MMVKSATDALRSAGIAQENITVYPVPGSFEIPLIGSVLAAHKKVDALIGIGIIVQGETAHADLLAAQTARGIMDVQVRYAIPFAFEVLHVTSLRQAAERSAKGEEAARAVLLCLAQIGKIHS